MKKTLIMGLLSALSLVTYAQKADSTKTSIQKNAESIGHGGNNELKVNLLYSVIGMPEISYERIIEDNMGLGASVFVGLDNGEYRFGFIPHFRLYFGAKKASGFFIEGNASVVTIRDTDYFYYEPMYGSGYVPNHIKNSTINFGLGAAAGAKFLTRNGFLGEAYLGLGRFFGERTDYGHEVYPRIGITIGKRF